MESKYVLVVSNKASNTEKRYTLEEGKEILVGANPMAAIPVEDQYMSYNHFSINVNGGKVEVKDLKSTNGLYLQIDGSVLISPGQTIIAGKSIFKLEQEGDPCSSEGERQPDSTPNTKM
ncbi:MAG: FHA domain-containing protein [bacterium]